MSAISIKHHSVDRRFVAIGAVVLFLLSSLLLVTPQEDVDASSESAWLVHLNESEGANDGVVKTLRYDGVDSMEVRVQTDSKKGQSSDNMDRTVQWRFINNDLSSSQLHVYEQFTYADGTVDDANSFIQSISGSESYWSSWNTYGNSAETWGRYYSDNPPVKIVTYVVAEWNGEQDSDNIISFTFEFDLYQGYRYTTSVSYDLNGGSGSIGTDSVVQYTDSASSEKVKFTLADTPDHPDGLEFGGWADSNNLTHPAGSEMEVTIGSDVVLTAVWNIPSSTITFWSDGIVYTTVAVDTGSTATPPEDPEKEGMVFLGWFEDVGCKRPFDWTSGIDTDIDLYAGWEEELIFTSDPIAHGTVTKVNGIEGTYLFQIGENTNSETVLWDFGDGTTSTQRAVTHYFEPGEHTITLTVYNSVGENSTEFHITVEDGDDGADLPITWIAAAVLIVMIAIVIVWRFL